MILRFLTLLALASAAGAQPAPAVELALPAIAPRTLAKSAKLAGPTYSREVSGIVASRQWPGVFWLHNDSGDEPRVYPMRPDGSLVTSARTADHPGILVGGAANSDWEAIAVDASGRLIIADVGNNSNGRRDLALHYVMEPEPTAGFTTVLKSVFIRYPEQRTWPAGRDDFNYDCEGVFTVGDTVYFVTKRRSDTLTRLYRLDDPREGRVNDLTALADFNVRGRATAADATPDGQRLLILTYDAMWMFEASAPGRDDWFAGAVWWLPFTGAPGAEGVCFDGPDRILIAAEEGNGHLYELPTSALVRVR